MFTHRDTNRHKRTTQCLSWDIFLFIPFNLPPSPFFCFFPLVRNGKKKLNCLGVWVSECLCASQTKTKNTAQNYCLTPTVEWCLFVCLFARMFNQKHWTMSCCLYISLCSDANQRKCKVPFAFGFQMKTYEWWRKQTRERERERAKWNKVISHRSYVCLPFHKIILTLKDVWCETKKKRMLVPALFT